MTSPAAATTSTDPDELVRRYFSSKLSSEEQFLINFCRTVLSNGRPDRFHVFGFSLPDVQEYLPVERVLGGDKSWAQLRAEFDAQTKVRSFKPWLKAQYKADIDEAALARGLAAMDAIPPDFLALAELCREATSPARRDRQRRSSPG